MHISTPGSLWVPQSGSNIVVNDRIHDLTPNSFHRPSLSESPPGGEGRQLDEQPENPNNYPYVPQNDQMARTAAAYGQLFTPAEFPMDEQAFIPDQPDNRQSLNLQEGHGQYVTRATEHVRPSPSQTEASLHSGSGSSGSLEAQNDIQRGQPIRPLDFNRDLYPAFDETGKRRGFDHLHGPPEPRGLGDYYPARTYAYPPAQPGDEIGQARTSSANVSHAPGRRREARTVFYDAPPLDSLSGFIGFPPEDSSARPGPMRQNSDFGVSPPNVVGSNQPQPGSTRQNIHANRPATSGPPLGGDIPLSRDALAEMMGMEPGVPLSLSSLRDPEDGQKPDYTYPVLIKLAIHESPTSCLTLQEIYEVIQRRFPWYANCSKKDAAAWRNSIRHTLSLLAIFQKKSRPITEPGKGHYWYLDFTKGAGYKRQRKRNKKPTKAQLAKQAEAEQQEQDGGDETSGSASEEPDESIDPVLKNQSKRPSRNNSNESTSRGRGHEGGNASVNRTSRHGAGRSRASPYPNTRDLAPSGSGSNGNADGMVDVIMHSPGPNTSALWHGQGQPTPMASPPTFQNFQQFGMDMGYPAGSTAAMSGGLQQFAGAGRGMMGQGQAMMTQGGHSFEMQQRQSLAHPFTPSLDQQQSRGQGPRFGQPSTFNPTNTHNAVGLSGAGQTSPPFVSPPFVSPGPSGSGFWSGNSSPGSFSNAPSASASTREPTAYDRNAAHVRTTSSRRYEVDKSGPIPVAVPRRDPNHFQPPHSRHSSHSSGSFNDSDRMS